MESHTNEKIRLLYSLQMINNYAQVSSGEREREKERERERLSHGFDILCKFYTRLMLR